MKKALSELGREAEAFALIEKLLKENPDEPRARSYYAVLLAKRGQQGRAEEQIQRVARAARNERGYSSYHHAQYNVGAAYALMGQNRPAIEWLQKAADEGFPCFPFIDNDPDLAHLRDDAALVLFMTKLRAEWERYTATL